jgi:translation initiation factor IF-1
VDSDGAGRSGECALTCVRLGSVEAVEAVENADAKANASLTGLVVELLPSAMYRVRLDAGHHVLAHVADRIDRNFVRVLVGDRVDVELSPVDAGRGRIVGKS